MSGVIAIGINLTSHGWQKRIWFEVHNDEISKTRFENLSQLIKDIDDSKDWKEFLKLVEELFMVNGFYRIRK